MLRKGRGEREPAEGRGRLKAGGRELAEGRGRELTESGGKGIG